MDGAVLLSRFLFLSAELLRAGRHVLFIYRELSDRTLFSRGPLPAIAVDLICICRRSIRHVAMRGLLDFNFV